MVTKSKWLQLCMLLLSSLLFNTAFNVPAKFTRHTTEQVQQVTPRAVGAIPAFVVARARHRSWRDMVADSGRYCEPDIAVELKHQQLVCLTIAQAPPVYRLQIPAGEEEPALS